MLNNVLGYHVFNGYRWLADDEKTWTTEFQCSASFTDPKLAQDIGERQGGDDTIYVMACMGYI